MSRNDGVDQLVTRLVRGTINGTVKWSSVPPPPYFLIGNDEVYPLFFTTYQNEICVGVYEVRYRFYTDETDYSWSSSYGICVFKRYSNEIILDERNAAYLDSLILQAQRSAYDASNVIDNLFKF